MSYSTTPHNQNPRHSLSGIDKDSLTAICAVCGLTDVRRYTRDNRYTTYVCIKGNRQRSAAYQLAHPKISRLQQRRTTFHILSNVNDEKRTADCSICGPVRIYIRRGKIYDTRVCRNAANKRSQKAVEQRRADNLEFIENYKLSHGCKNCASHDISTKLEFHAPGKSRREDHMNKLLSFNREHLILELEKYDVLCKNCHDQVHYKPSSKPRRKHKPLPFMSHTT
jgi:hypothetical protein